MPHYPQTEVCEDLVFIPGVFQSSSPALLRQGFEGHPAQLAPRAKQDGGAYRDRTDDLKLAKLALSQLS